MRLAPRVPLALAAALLPLTSARADELTVSAINALATAPWTDTLVVPQFAPSQGTLQSVRLELRATLRGRVAYENLAASPASASIVAQASLSAHAVPPAPTSIDVTVAAPVSIQTQAFDGANDQSGASGGVLANMVVQRAATRTITGGGGFAAFQGTGSVAFSVTAANTSAQLGGAPLSFNARASVSAELLVTYVYLPPADCDSDGVPDASEADADGDGLPDDCDRSNANHRRPGSLLVFPEFDDLSGSLTVLTVTNTQNAGAPVRVRYVYIEGATCLEANRTRTLAANDMFSALTALDNPNGAQRGYAYVYAVDAGGNPISHDHLAGASLRLDGFNGYAYGIDAFAFRAGPGLTLTDVDGDGLRDLNGIEYERVPDELVFPRFIGSLSSRESDLIVLNLTGGPGFTAIVSMFVWNDNAQVFSVQHSFSCWDKRPLSTISGAFTNVFLQSTAHDPNEIQGFTSDEAGWVRMDGTLSFSAAVQIPDPAVLAVLVERTSAPRYAVELPFELGEQGNGDLVITSPNGDTIGD